MLLPCGYLASWGSSNDFVCSKFPFARLAVNCLWIPILPANYLDEHQGGLGRPDWPSYTGVATCRNAATTCATSNHTANPFIWKLKLPPYYQKNKKTGNYFKRFKQRLSKSIADPWGQSETCASSWRGDRNSAINIEHTWREEQKCQTLGEGTTAQFAAHNSIAYFQFNFVGRILGPRGLTAKQLEQETGCKVMVRGKGSMRDKKKVRFRRF